MILRHIILTFCVLLPCVGFARCENNKHAAPVKCLSAPQDTLKKQTPVEEQDTIYGVAEVMPQYPDGDLALLQTITKTLVYPAKAKKAGKQGLVVAKFVVERDGSIGSPQIDRSLSPECDEAAIKAIKGLKHFSPGKINGEPVRVRMMLPILFKLSQ